MYGGCKQPPEVARLVRDGRVVLRNERTLGAFQGGEKMKPIFRSSPLAAPSKNSLHFFIDATRYFALCGERQGLHVLDLCKLLKKLDQNFYTAVALKRFRGFLVLDLA